MNEAFDAEAPGLPVTAPCAATTCLQLGSRAVAFDRSGRRTALVIGADSAVAETLSPALTGRGQAARLFTRFRD